MLKGINPAETYVVREVLCCGHGHCPGVNYTHWEAGEACIMGHTDGPKDNNSLHLYHRLVLVPKWRGTKQNPYEPDTGDMWEYMNLPENSNKWCHFPIAPKGSKVGDVVVPRRSAA
jgi:hypothetical protein